MNDRIEVGTIGIHHCVVVYPRRNTECAAAFSLWMICLHLAPKRTLFVREKPDLPALLTVFVAERKI